MLKKELINRYVNNNNCRSQISTADVIYDLMTNDNHCLYFHFIRFQLG